MDKTFDITLKETMQKAIKDYLHDNLSIIVETEPPSWVEESHKITVKIAIDGEIIDSSSDTIYIPS